MKIKNYIVEEKEKFIDALERELCKNDITYVKLNNKIDYWGRIVFIKEIHFLNRIIRFYDPETDILAIRFMLLIPSPEIDIKNDKIEDNIFNRNQERFMEFVPEDEEVKFEKTTKPYQVRNKFIQKQESNKVKQMLKRYQR